MLIRQVLVTLAVGSLSTRFKYRKVIIVALGTNAALRANTTASNNTAVGTDALLLNTTGCQNTAVGS
jgi:hypothetical protein